jgi:UDP-hydrolysing UDP-N-acetyl-D-glucosamine 2-epimerase
MKRKVCIVTATRAEYGPMRWLIEDVQNDPALELQLVVTGTHLSVEHGYTYDEILKDGFVADEMVEMSLAQTDQRSLVKAMGQCQIGLADAFDRLQPDILVVLGDRYELLPICSSAVVMKIPIAHISGGDVTEGAIDEQVRHAITKMAWLHFPGTVDSARRIVQMGESSDRVFSVGEPGLDALRRADSCSKLVMAEDLGLDVNSKWVLFTYHPETMSSIEDDLDRVKAVVEFFLTQDDVHLVATGANADCGGSLINEYLQGMSRESPERICFQMNLGSRRYIQFLRHTSCVVGNSSSGIIEAPALKVPVLNIGERQRGRFLCKNIISCRGTLDELNTAYQRIVSADFSQELAATEAYYGDGETSGRIVRILKESPLESVKKVFHEGGRAV